MYARLLCLDVLMYFTRGRYRSGLADCLDPVICWQSRKITSGGMTKCYLPALFYVSVNYLTVTARAACPPKLLRTVMFCGFTDTLNCPRNCPPPLFVSVPISCPLDVTKTCSVAFDRMLVASTRSVRFPDSHSAREIETVSVAETDGLIVRLAERDVPFRAAVIVADVVADT